MSQAANLRVVEGTSVDKTKALDAALSQIERAFGKGSIMRLGKNQKPVEIETVSTGSLGLDIALGVGGLPRGRIVEIYGPESSGKTTLTLHVIAEAQKAGGVCAFVDAEHALDPVYAKKLGVQLDELLISQPDTGEQALEITDTLVRSGAVDVLVVDSVAALTPRAGYNFCIDPSDKEIPLYDAFTRWLILSLECSGASTIKARKLADVIARDAKQRFHLRLSSNDSDASWICSYLVLERVESIPAIASDLRNIKNCLANWTDPVTSLKEQQKNAWGRYRKILESLPDDKDTMYNEDFGVRQVFITPQARYYVAGAKGTAGSPQNIPDISKLLGALVSNRIPGDDLVIMCGGPGSGKSSFCRMLASELAQDPMIHPVFLKLRRCNEGLDICSFVADNLRNFGLIREIADLHEVPNLVLILDGFDELVMASRQRLRLFFNHLQDDSRTGPFRNAKVIVSGRDTLFPNGQGLPWGSHIITLLPFDKRRVKAWGDKWRKRNKTHAIFEPDIFYEEDEAEAKNSALHHLVTWPLTLHLVAQVHSAGYLDTTEETKKNMEKAYLYRSILAETAKRQEEKRSDTGRLDSLGIREFLGSLAWEMYTKSIDSLDMPDAVKIIEKFFPHASQEDLQDLSDTNVLNAPEIQKKEETGFEFVHKSFSEYLVAERLAAILEDVCYKVPDRTTKVSVWHMSSDDVTQKLTSILGLRLIPAEVQEMLEPMLGCFDHFLKNTNVRDTVPAGKRIEGLRRLTERFDEIYCDMLRGTALRRTQDATEGKLLIESPLEAYANYAAGVAIIGSAAACQLNEIEEAGTFFFQGNPFEGAFWRFIWILQAGGIRLDKSTSIRLFSGMTVRNDSLNERIGDWSIPLCLNALTNVEGYQTDLRNSVMKLYCQDVINSAFNILVNVLPDDVTNLRSIRLPPNVKYTDRKEVSLFDAFYYRSASAKPITAGLVQELFEANMIPDNPLAGIEQMVAMEVSKWSFADRKEALASVRRLLGYLLDEMSNAGVESKSMISNVPIETLRKFVELNRELTPEAK